MAYLSTQTLRTIFVNVFLDETIIFLGSINKVNLHIDCAIALLSNINLCNQLNAVLSEHNCAGE